MKRFTLAAAILALATPALAQQPPRPATPAELQAAASALNAQVDAIRGLHIQAEIDSAKRAAQLGAQIRGLSDENAKLQAEIKELKAGAAPVAPDQK